jgi:cytochrome P450
MALYPDVQRKAQEEIDRLVGHDRLPTCADRKLLPYVDALSKEVTRWHVVAPLGQICEFSFTTCQCVIGFRRPALLLRG